MEIKKNAKFVLFVLIVLVSLFLFKKIKKQQESGESIAEIFSASINQSDSAQPKLLSPEEVTKLMASESTAPENKKIANGEPANNKSLQEYINLYKNDGALTGFMQRTKLSINTPTNYKFKTLNLGDSFAAIQAASPNGDAQISLIAKEGSFSDSNISEIITNFGEQFSHSDILTEQDVSKIRKIQAPENSGLTNARVLTVESNGNEIHIYTADRTDGKGSYAAIVSGNSEFLENNENRFDRLAESVHAHP
jgi:hypothetical protein